MGNKRINKCPSWDEHFGCAISPMKKCSSCASADWYREPSEKKKKTATISKERYEHLLECERFTTWVLNSVVYDSLPYIELTKQKTGELSNDEKLKSIKAAFNEALKQKEKLQL